jgi:fused signal recognition particle receptor
MPTGVGFDLIVAALLVALLVAAVLVARLQNQRPVRIEADPSPSEERERGLGPTITPLLGSGEPTEEEWEQFEEVLIQADVGRRAARRLVTGMRDRLRPGRDPVALLVEEMAGIFVADPLLSLPNRFAVVMVVGPPQSGKTITTGKLAHRLVNQGRLVALGACGADTGAGVRQLAAWADLSGAELAPQKNGGDPGATSYEAIEWARARGSDALILDAAIRMEARKQQLEEVARIRRVLEKAAGRTHEALLCLDATSGQEGIMEAMSFIDAAGVRGIALTKQDKAERSGIALAARAELQVPLKLVGTGEGIDDLRAFDGRWFAERLVSG